MKPQQLNINRRWDYAAVESGQIEPVIYCIQPFSHSPPTAPLCSKHWRGPQANLNHCTAQGGGKERGSVWSQRERRAADRWREGFSGGRKGENVGLWRPCVWLGPEGSSQLEQWKHQHDLTDAFSAVNKATEVASLSFFFPIWSYILFSSISIRT